MGGGVILYIGIFGCSYAYRYNTCYTDTTQETINRFLTSCKRRKGLIENFPNKKYQVIYADPPWSYYNDMTVDRSANKTGAGSMTHPSYPVMSSKDIKALPVGNIADNDSILFMWTTDYHLCIAMDVIKAWGFEYKTVGFAWQKLNKKKNLFALWGHIP